MPTIVPADSLRPTRSDTVAFGDSEIAYTDRDRTRPYLLLHGGGGVLTMTGFADLLAERTHARVLLPTHPGFGGTARSASLGTVKDLAAAYVAMLDQLDLSDVTVLGNSFGGWVATEIALLGSARVSGIVLVDAIGVEVEGHPMTSAAGLAPADLHKLSWHDPAKAPQPPTGGGAPGPSPDIAALIGYAGPTMSDPTLLDRLRGLELPVQIIWGASDGIVDTEYGKALAEALPFSTFTVLADTGHLPQFETPEELLGAIIDLGN